MQMRNSSPAIMPTPTIKSRPVHGTSTPRPGSRHIFVADAEGARVILALDAGIGHASIETGHRGSLGRPLQCIHCKGIAENVTTRPAVCAHCGLTLLVRDYYSRRIAAFQGGCIDAEDPGVVPPTAEAFP